MAFQRVERLPRACASSWYWLNRLLDTSFGKNGQGWKVMGFKTTHGIQENFWLDSFVIVKKTKKKTGIKGWEKMITHSVKKEDRKGRDFHRAFYMFIVMDFCVKEKRRYNSLWWGETVHTLYIRLVWCSSAWHPPEVLRLHVAGVKYSSLLDWGRDKRNMNEPKCMLWYMHALC